MLVTIGLSKESFDSISMSISSEGVFRYYSHEIRRGIIILIIFDFASPSINEWLTLFM